MFQIDCILNNLTVSKSSVVDGKTHTVSLFRERKRHVFFFSEPSHDHIA
jgi:hypothetical protein